MSTIDKTNFEPVSDIIPVVRRGFKASDVSLVQPGNANCFIDGEWLVVNDTGKVVRATDIAVAGAKALNGGKRVRSFPLFSERGRTDVQALTKLTLLYGGWFEADTRIFDASAKATGGAETQYPAISYVGQPLQVATVTIGGRALSGLVGADVDSFTSNIPFIVAWVSRLPAYNNGRLRIRVEPCR